MKTGREKLDEMHSMLVEVRTWAATEAARKYDHAIVTEYMKQHSFAETLRHFGMSRGNLSYIKNKRPLFTQTTQGLSQ